MAKGNLTPRQVAAIKEKDRTAGPKRRARGVKAGVRSSNSAKKGRR
jgi:hypothetical protein